MVNLAPRPLSSVPCPLSPGCTMMSRKLEPPDDIEEGVSRHCTDVPFVIVIVMAWVAMTYLGFDAIQQGNPDILLNGIDYNGRICGVDSAVEDKPNVCVFVCT